QHAAVRGRDGPGAPDLAVLLDDLPLPGVPIVLGPAPVGGATGGRRSAHESADRARTRVPRKAAGGGDRGWYERGRGSAAERTDRWCGEPRQLGRGIRGAAWRWRGRVVARRQVDRTRWWATGALVTRLLGVPLPFDGHHGLQQRVAERESATDVQAVG